MYYLITIVLLYFTINLQGQSDHNVQFGIKGGINFDSFKARDKMTDSPVGGDSAESYYSLLSEIKLHDKEYLNINATYAITSNINFIQVPLHYRKMIYKKWSAFAGPQLDFLINDKLVNLEEDVVLKKYGFAIAGGIQKDFKEKWFFEVRYSIGLTEFVEDINPFIEDIKVNELRIGLGYYF